MGLQFSYPDREVFDRLEDEFLKELRDQPVLGKPEFSVENRLTGLKSPVAGRSLNVIEPYLDNLVVVSTFRGVDKEEFQEKVKAEAETYHQIHEDVEKRTFGPDRELMAKINDEIGDFFHAEYCIDSELENFVDPLREALYMEEGLNSSEELNKNFVQFSAIGIGDNSEVAYTDMRDDLSIDIFFTYGGELSSFEYDFVEGKISFQDQDPEYRIFEEKEDEEIEEVRDVLYRIKEEWLEEPRPDQPLSK